MFTLTIRTDNAAFVDPDGAPAPGYELATILRRLAGQLENASDGDHGTVRDSNGNTVGKWELEGSAD